MAYCSRNVVPLVVPRRRWPERVPRGVESGLPQPIPDYLGRGMEPGEGARGSRRLKEKDERSQGVGSPFSRLGVAG